MIYFSILTLLTAETFRLVAYYWTDLTSGTLGIQYPRLSLGPIGGHVIKFDLTTHNYYYIAIGVVVLCLLILYHFERAYVFQWRAIRDDGMLAGAVGIGVIGYKIFNFVIAAFMAGISEAVRGVPACPQRSATSRFAVTTSIYLLVYAWWWRAPFHRSHHWDYDPDF